LEYKELICEYFPDGWVHVAYEHGNNKKQLKLKDLHHSYDLVSIDYINSIY
jgi:lysine/ornithine N-monooxygenase